MMRLFAALSCLACVASEGFLRSNGAMEGVVNAKVLGEDIINAMDEILGCGDHEVAPEKLVDIKKVLEPMWQTMPSMNGNLPWQSVRYIAHRYFMQQSSLVIRGFEPSRVLNSSESGVAELLAKEVPDHADVLFGGKHAMHGYSIDHAVALIAALDRLVWDSEAHLLERTYKLYNMKPNRTLGVKQFQRLLEGYMVFWMMRGDERSTHILLRNRTLLDRSFPRWNELKGFIDGRIKALNWMRAAAPKEGDGTTLFDNSYSFKDAHEIVGRITTTFQDYWQSECESMKIQLVEMDRDGTGRVRLKDFYGTGLEKDWRFGESEQYLRELGVLDESSPWRGKQVIIPNYLQAASNCIVTTPQYHVCCKNECETLLGEIEIAVGLPTASPAQIVAIVSNMSAPSSDDTSTKINGAIVKQLENIAEGHGSEVPLHGRLFAQWIHYTFPRECPYPHKIGAYESHTLTPNAFGRSYIASKDEMRLHASEIDEREVPEDDEIFSQWSEEEELFVDYSRALTSPWQRQFKKSSCFGMLALIIAAVLYKSNVVGASKEDVARIPFHINSKTHMV